MTFSNDVFQQLISSYPTWDALQSFLTSPEGGHFRIVGDGKYRIISYIKGTSNMKLPHSSWMRSVVWDTEAHRPVCIAPPKAESTPVVVGALPTGENCKYLIQDFLDGVMINAFVTKDNPDYLHVCTRNSLGASGSFYSSKSFHDLFMEALHKRGLNKRSLLASLPKAQNDDSAIFISFVLQHPEHRVVAYANAPRLWIVHTGFVKNTGVFEVNELLDAGDKLARMNIPPFPMDNFATDQVLMSFFNDLCHDKGWRFQGITLKDGQGKRWRIRNEQFTHVRALRGGEALPLDRFLRLRQQGGIGEYLRCFPEEREGFQRFEQAFRDKTKEIYNAYCQVHKAHAIKLTDVPKDIQPSVFKLHAHYLETLKPNNQTVQMSEAITFINGLTTYDQRRFLV